MPIVAVLIFTIVSLAFTGFPGLPGLREPSRPWIPQYAFMPPERRSVLVDPEGQAHPTADRTQMTKRDRSKRFLISPTRYEDKTPLPTVEVSREPVEPSPPPQAATSAE